MTVPQLIFTTADITQVQRIPTFWLACVQAYVEIDYYSFSAKMLSFRYVDFAEFWIDSHAKSTDYA